MLLISFLLPPPPPLYRLYEALRTLRQKNMQNFEPLTDIFRLVELARMPLAKHEVKRTKKYLRTEHYPTSVWDIESGGVGWQVFDPDLEQMVVISRSDIADRFLTCGAEIASPPITN